jgi:hypothetical protein
MNKQLVTPVMAVMVIFAMAWGQSDPGKGTVAGRLVNGSRSMEGLANHLVTLKIFHRGREGKNTDLQTVTDSTGHFLFDGLEINEEVSYYPLVVYKGVEYQGNLVQLHPDAPAGESNITVYDTTTSDSAVTIRMHHVLAEPGDEVLRVREIRLLVNRGERTIIGAGSDAADKTGVLKFELPAEATNVQFAGDLMACCMVRQGNWAFDTMEFPPGTRQAVISYNLPYRGSSVQMALQSVYPTSELDVYLVEPMQLARFSVLGESAEKGTEPQDRSVAPEPFQIRDRTYARYVLGSFDPGNIVRLYLSGLPKVSGNLWWAAVVLLGLLLGLSYWLLRKGRRVDFPTTDPESDELL